MLPDGISKNGSNATREGSENWRIAYRFLSDILDDRGMKSFLELGRRHWRLLFIATHHPTKNLEYLRLRRSMVAS